MESGQPCRYSRPHPARHSPREIAHSSRARAVRSLIESGRRFVDVGARRKLQHPSFNIQRNFQLQASSFKQGPAPASCAAIWHGDAPKKICSRPPARHSACLNKRYSCVFSCARAQEWLFWGEQRGARSISSAERLPFGRAHAALLRRAGKFNPRAKSNAA